MRALIVDGDPAVVRLVTRQLEAGGILVVAASSSVEGIAALARDVFDVVILDPTVSDGSGFEVLDQARRRNPKTHVIVLSDAAGEADRVRGLALGADDYVVKPFYARELAARVLAVARRRAVTEIARLRTGPLDVDLTARAVHLDGVEVPMTRKEFDLLAYLAARPGHAFSREELLRSVWQSDAEWQQTSTVTEHVRRLRIKIEPDPANPVMLLTVRGLGYRFDATTAGAALRDPLAPPSLPGSLIHVDGTIVFAHDPGRLIAGNDGDLIGRHILDLVVPHSLPAAVEGMRLLAEGQRSRSVLLAAKRPDGGESLLETLSSWTEWEGAPARRVVFASATDDATRLRRLFTGVLSDLSDAVIVTDLDHHIRSWNRAAERLYGWSEPEVIGRHALDVLPWRPDEPVLGGVAASLEASGHWHGTVSQTTRDGLRVSVHSSVTLVREDSGEAIGIVSVNRALATVTEPGAARGSYSEDELRRALDNGELTVHYQPVVRIDEQRVVSVEALVRWNHREHGLMEAEQFIHAFEASDLMEEVGALVLGRACRQVAEWRRAGADINVSVNLSARELADPGLAARVTAMVATSQLDPAALWLEITESSLVTNVDAAAVTLHQLASNGIGVAIDDFGTGWASLTYLQRFPIHALKIDRSFVHGVDCDPRNRAIVRSIVSLANELGLFVTAEGIESPAEEEALVAIGCGLGQGYLYGRATAAELVPIDRAARLGTSQTNVVRGERTRGVGHAPSTAPVGPAAQGSAEIAATLLRGLLRITTARDAAALLQLAARQLGATLLPASEAGPDALPIDLALGEGPPVLASAEVLSVARMELERVLPGLVEDARTAVHLLRHSERLSEETNRDEVTGLANRRVLDRVLPRVGGGVIMRIDLDLVVRDDGVLGAPDDATLVAFAGALVAEARASYVSCRVAPAEFVLVADDIDGPRALDLVGRLRTAWVTIRPDVVTFSVGVASVSMAGGGAAALLAADRVLHRAKKLGSNRTVVEGTDAVAELVG